ncbi:nucleotidyltransferase family protein [Pseudoduganella ginsengisoli]|uniref:NTP transferase domain-containing protein n=1 Tax=Pseudoduganella ginsengisoli TaxID=1462440 RepID=A0A6L6Q8L4_9BURK|nr:nucleotidyltransferase family protein [Pseudoduganella ginsengisoli]MTW06127.1 NTP transferase domain-containing protein [Pseudoduganella ginsengisoli]
MGSASGGIIGILLAAGRGSRFDPSGAQNKLLQSLDPVIPAQAGTHAEAMPPARSVVSTSASNLLRILPRVIAVVRPGAEAVAAELSSLGCEVVICDQADTGMAASLVCALGQAPDADGWIVALGDMPRVAPGTILSLQYALAQGAGIAAPMYRGKRGNPVGFSRQYLPQLLALQGDQGARGILRQYPVQEVDVDDAGILQDIDTPGDLHQQGQP